jgi:hypothetical protein
MLLQVEASYRKLCGEGAKKFTGFDGLAFIVMDRKYPVYIYFFLEYDHYFIRSYLKNGGL